MGTVPVLVQFFSLDCGVNGRPLAGESRPADDLPLGQPLRDAQQLTQATAEGRPWLSQPLLISLLIHNLLHRDPETFQGIRQPLGIEKRATRAFVGAFQADRAEEQGLAVVIHPYGGLQQEQATASDHLADPPKPPEGEAQVVEHAGANHDVEGAELVYCHVIDVQLVHPDTGLEIRDEELGGPPRKIIVDSDDLTRALPFSREGEQPVAAADVENALPFQIERTQRLKDHCLSSQGAGVRPAGGTDRVR